MGSPVWLHPSRRLYPAGDAHRSGTCHRFVRPGRAGCGREPRSAPLRTCVHLEMRAEIARSLEELNRRFIPQCESCGAPMVRVSDVVREVEAI
jgi:hypothetical protein